MPDFLGSLVDDEVIRNANGIFKNRNAKKNSLQQLVNDASGKPQPVVNEHSLTTDYRRRVAAPCSVIASTLIFQLQQWTNVFQWNETSMTNAHAQPDGILKINSASPNFKKLTKEHQESVKLLQAHGLGTLALWEFKSLVAANKEVMEGIGRLSGNDFRWTTCRASDCNRHYTAYNVLTATGHKTGPDARQTEDISKISALPLDMIKNKADPLPVYKDAESCEAPVLDNTSKAHYIVQQVRNQSLIHDTLDRSHFPQLWAELVNSDATFVVLNAGNFEIIGRRHRSSQTLYISPLIDISATAENPSYYKLHIGLYIVAWRDACERATSLKNMLLQPEEDWLSRYRRDYNNYPLSSPARKLSKNQSLEFEKVTLSK